MYLENVRAKYEICEMVAITSQITVWKEGRARERSLNKKRLIK